MHKTMKAFSQRDQGMFHLVVCTQRVGPFWPVDHGSSFVKQTTKAQDVPLDASESLPSWRVTPSETCQARMAGFGFGGWLGIDASNLVGEFRKGTQNCCDRFLFRHDECVIPVRQT